MRPIPVRPAPPSGRESFERAAFAAFIARARTGQADDPAAVCRTLFPDDGIAPRILSRAAVPGASTSGWGAELVQTAFGDFVSSLPASAAAALIQRGTKVRLSTRSLRLPVRSDAPVTLPWVGEGMPIPVRAGAVVGATVEPRKAGVIVLLTHELAAMSDALAIFTSILREDAAKTIDAGYFSTAAGDATVHPGLLAGVTPLTAASGSGRDAMGADLASLAAAVSPLGAEDIVFVMAPARAAKVPILSPELRSTVLASAAVPADRVVAVDAASLVHAFDVAPEIDVSEETVIHRSDSPAQIGAAGTPNVVAAPVQSMFQTAMIALRVLADVAFAKRRADAVAYIDGVAW